MNTHEVGTSVAYGGRNFSRRILSREEESWLWRSIWVRAVCVLVLLASCNTPSSVYASVRISEVAWMGSTDDANNEWIELYNDGSETDVTGWILSAADGQPAITLTGTIGGSGYFLLERTDDTTVPEVTAGQIYTGALGNDGETLSLTDAAGAQQDLLNGSSAWDIGGDNALHLTLQRTASGWVTAEGTPGRANATNDSSAYVEAQAAETNAASEGNSDGQSESSSSSSGGSSKSSKTAQSTTKKAAAAPVPLAPALNVVIGPDRTVPVNVPTYFDAQLTKEGGKSATVESVTWNFGDGATGAGQSVHHTYTYPGDYVVQVEAERPLFSPPLVARDRMIVHVVPLSVRVSAADTLSIELTNDSATEFDLSGFYLAVGKRHFRVPQGTLLLPEGKVRFPAIVTKLVVTDPSAVGIFTPSRSLAAQYAEGEEEVLFANQPLDEEEAGEEGSEENETNEEDEEAQEPVTEEQDTAGEMFAVAPPQEGQSEQGGAGKSQGAALAYAFGHDGLTQGTKSVSLWWWILGLVAVLLIAAVTVVLLRREEEEVILGYTIDDDE